MAVKGMETNHHNQFHHHCILELEPNSFGLTAQYSTAWHSTAQWWASNALYLTLADATLPRLDAHSLWSNKSQHRLAFDVGIRQFVVFVFLPAFIFLPAFVCPFCDGVVSLRQSTVSRPNPVAVGKSKPVKAMTTLRRLVCRSNSRSIASLPGRAWGRGPIDPPCSTWRGPRLSWANLHRRVQQLE